MNEVKIKIDFNAYYNERKGVFDDGGVYPILEYLKDNKLKDALRKLTDDSRYSWAFKKGIPHIINYDEGYLLKMYKDCYV